MRIELHRSGQTATDDLDALEHRVRRTLRGLGAHVGRIEVFLEHAGPAQRRQAQCHVFAQLRGAGCVVLGETAASESAALESALTRTALELEDIAALGRRRRRTRPRRVPIAARQHIETSG